MKFNFRVVTVNTAAGFVFKHIHILTNEKYPVVKILKIDYILQNKVCVCVPAMIKCHLRQVCLFICLFAC